MNLYDVIILLPDQNMYIFTCHFFALQWDILSNGGLVQEMAHIANGRDPGNSVSLLRVNVSPNSTIYAVWNLESCPCWKEQIF